MNIDKPALTPSGVNQKTKELYELSDSALLAQVALIGVDLLTWIVDNFKLTVAQYDFLICLDPAFIEVFKGQVSRAVANKWPVTYIPGVGTQDIASANAGEKWIKSKEESSACSQADVNGYSGSLIVNTGISIS